MSRCMFGRQHTWSTIDGNGYHCHRCGQIEVTKKDGSTVIVASGYKPPSGGATLVAMQVARLLNGSGPDHESGYVNNDARRLMDAYTRENEHTEVPG